MKKHNILFLTLVFLLVSYLPKADAQEIPNVVISEVHTGRGVFPSNPYYEISNVGSETVNLSNYRLGAVGYWSNAQGPMLPDKELASGESFVVAIVRDLAEKNWNQELHLPGINARNRPDIWEHADLKIHVDEGTEGPNGGLDSIYDPSMQAHSLIFNRHGVNSIYLEYHPSETDSIVIDAFRNDSLEEEDGRIGYGTAREIAGIPMDLMNNWVLVRKTNVTTGNTNWDDARGTSLENSEWLPLRIKESEENGGGGWYPKMHVYRPFFTTIGNHAEGELNEEYVSSDVIDIDWDNQKMTVPWGIYRDTIMEEFNLGKGIGWYYHYDNEVSDSFSNIVQSGDTLTLKAVGPTLEQMDFEIEQDSAAEDMNLVFPYNSRNWDEETGATSFSTPWYVTEDHPVIDSVGGLPYRVRKDSLLKFLEKAPNASWEIAWNDDAPSQEGVERVDVYRGDTLRVTAEDGSVKNYYLSVDSVPEPSDNADLAAITWPDAPEFVRQNPNWTDDTIPGFGPSRTMYQLKVPYNTEKIPALVASPADLNAQITIDRATNINGTVENRTFTFTVAAEDDTTIQTYSVIIEKEKPEELVQPLEAEPLFTEYIFRGGHKSFMEVTNPGNQPLDMSNYIFIGGFWRTGTTPAEMISDELDLYEQRSLKVIPGYKPVSEEQWTNDPGLYEKDLEVNPIVQPGETFVCGFTPVAWAIPPIAPSTAEYVDMLWMKSGMTDQYEALSTEREEYGTENTKLLYKTGNMWFEPWNKNRPMVMLKIMNDSILNGSKPVGDIEDFKVIDVFGNYQGEAWSPGTDTMSGKGWVVRRKPEYWKPDSLPGVVGSFGTTDDSSEWITYKLSEHPGFDSDGSVGIHSFDPITEYQSTVTSLTYKVSDGYKRGQSITGVVEGTTGSELMGGLEKVDPGQTMEVVGKSDGDALAQGDTLKVWSADSTNYTTYGINIGALSDDAMLTSTEYEITADDEAGTGVIAGIPFGTSVKEVRNNVTKPDNATLNIIDEDDNLVPMQKRNYDTLYVNTQATGYISFEVIAENGESEITYQLELELGDSAAYATSELYDVDQELNRIELIPQGTNVQTFFTHLKPNKDASIKLIDKAGFERHLGPVRFDDQVVVTSPDSTNEKIYNLKFQEEKDGTEAWVVSKDLGVDQRAGDIWGIQQDLQINLLEGLLTPAPQANMHFLSPDSTELSPDEEVERGYLLKVISGDSLTEKYYNLYFSEEKPGTGAYVTSDTLNVTDEMVIEGLEMGATVSDLLANVIPAPKATMEVLDASGNPVESGELAQGYQLEVTSGDMQKQVVYDVTLITAVEPELAEKEISVYPNPATNNIYVDGIRANSQVVVRNVFGSIVKMIDSQDIQNGQVSVSSLPSGIYFISIETEDFQSEPVRLIKE